MKKILTYSHKILGWALISTIVVAILAGLLIQTNPAKKKIRSIAERKASDFINGTLSISGIDGNFFTSLILKNIVLKQNNDTVIFIAGVNAKYRLWPLLSGKLFIQSVNVNRPKVFLRQINDSIWNIQQVIKISSQTDTASGTRASFAAELSSLRIIEGALDIKSADTLIPGNIDHLNADLSLYWSDQEQQLKLDNLSVSSRDPGLTVGQLSFLLERDDQNIKLKNFHLKTARNNFEGKAEYSGNRNEKSSAELRSDPIRLDEFSYFLAGTKIPATPVALLNLKMLRDTLYATVSLSDQEQKIRVDLASPNFTDFLYLGKDTILRYQLQAQLDHIDLKHWLGNPALNYLLNGKLSLYGKGTAPGTAMAVMDGKLEESRFADKTVDRLAFHFNLDRGNIRGSAEGSGDFGAFRISPTIRNLGRAIEYNAELTTRHLNLALLTGNNTLGSSINMNAKVTGKGLDPKKLSARAIITLSGSGFMQVLADTLFSRLYFENENLRIDTLHMETGDLKIQAHGNYSMKSRSDLWIKAGLEGMKTLNAFMPEDSLQGTGTLRGHLYGIPDSLNVQADIDLNELHYGNFSLKKISGRTDALITAEDTVLNAYFSASKPGNDSFRLDSLFIQLNGTPDSLFIAGQLTNKELRSQVEAGLHPGADLKIVLNKWLIDYKNEHWELTQAPATIELDSTAYRINNFRLVSENADTSQYILADGTISRSGPENFKLKVANLDINRLASLFYPETPVSGLANINMDLTGNAATPLFSGNFNIEKALINNYAFTKLGGTAIYQENKFGIKINGIPKDSGNINFSGNIPLQVRMDSMNLKLNPKDSVSALLAVDEFPLSVLRFLHMNEEINGKLNGKITVQGTIESPDPSGNFAVQNGAFKIPQYGIDYREIAFNMKILPENITVDTFRIKTSDGDMNVTGQAGFNADSYRGNISNPKIKINFHKFNPIDQDQLNMQVSGDAGLSGENGDLVFNGNLKVPEAEIYLPALFSMMGKLSTSEVPEPILVKEMKKMKAGTDTLAAISDAEKEEEGDSLNFDFFNSLTGNLKVNIPKNTWIKNEDMHVEIAGDLELIKHKSFMEIFGGLNVVRGQYELLGKTFVIDQGTVNFQGGEEINPRLNISASYRFRNMEQVKQDLTVNITGTLEQPAISFALEGDSINEGDALSYMLFGKSMNELSLNQQSGIAGSGEANMASKAAASLISSQLSSYLGQKLNVDYLEIKSAGGNFDNATVVVGKYITNDLFMSYEQKIGNTSTDDDTNNYEVKLEYQLFRFLFLQMNSSSDDSGFDVIFKFENK